MKASVRLLFLSVFTLSFLFANSQEYDDLYFSKKDRKKLKNVEKNAGKKDEGYPYQSEYTTEEQPEESGNSSFLGRQYQYNGDEATEVSQESIDKYKRSNIDDYQEGEIVEEIAYDNANYSVPDTYQEPVVVNNYYGSGWGQDRFRFRNRFGFNNSLWAVSFGNPWYDPYWDPYFRSGVSVNIGFGWGWGRFGRWGGFYDPFWCPPYFGNSYAIGYYNGFYRGNYRPVVYRDSERRGRTVQRGARNSRGGAVSSSGRSSRVRNTSVASSRSDSRDFAKKQAQYLNRSRAARTVNTNPTRINSRSGTSSTSTRSRVSNSSNSGRSNSSFSRPSSTTRQRSYTPNRSSGSSRSSGTVRSGSSRSRSSAPSRSSGSVRSSSSSRSSGSVRSSGSSRSSSGRSSSGRSSSGKSSSSRSRGN